MDLTKDNERLRNALAFDRHETVSRDRLQAVIKPLVDAISGMNKEIISLQKMVTRLETQLRSQQTPPRKDE